jgi:Ino eighty subunit 1
MAESETAAMPPAEPTSREHSAAPETYSPGSTIDDPELDRAQPVDTENEASPHPRRLEPESSPYPQSVSPSGPEHTRRGSGHDRRGKRGRFERAYKKPKGSQGKSVLWIREGPHEGTEDDGSVVSSSAYQKPYYARRSVSPRSDPDTRHTVGTMVGTRRQANGTVGSVYSGSKIRHIKKDDGTPLWRKDIQYEFLRTVVDDKTAVFTRISDEKKDCNFADIYIDAMARSSKTSKVLKDRLQMDRSAAQNMAMICLLVNVGRMNTTLNFFPEMRAQLRTYHSIPSLQAYKSQKDYKSLQDAPRLKSILKGASEDNENEPRTLAQLQRADVPRTNPVNLIFILSQYAPKVSETHFTSSIDFFDLVIRPTLSSASRARAFLWLMWWYLESDFTAESAKANPFGPGEFEEGNPFNEEIAKKVPALEVITEEQGNLENSDPEEERLFADKMQKERKRLLETEPEKGGIGDPDSKLVQRWRKQNGELNTASEEPESELESERLGSPAVTGPGGVQGLLNLPAGGNPAQPQAILGGMAAESLDEEWEAVDPHPGRGRYKRTKANTANRRKRPRKESDAEITPTVSRSGRPLVQSARALEREVGTPLSDYGNAGTPVPYPTLQKEASVSASDRRPRVGGDSNLSRARAKAARREEEERMMREAGMGTMERTQADGKRRPRPLTQHQKALEEHKRERVEWVLRGWKSKQYERVAARRGQVPFVVGVARRIQSLPDAYDSDEEEGAGWGIGGLVGRVEVGNAEGRTIGGDDYGEEAAGWLKGVVRARKRVLRWSGGDGESASARKLSRPRDYPSKDADRDADGDQVMMDADQEDGDAEGDTTIVRNGHQRHASRLRGGQPANDLTGLDDIDRSLLAERSDDQMDEADADVEEDEDDDTPADVDESDR